MSPFDQRLRANLVHVDVEGGSGMIFCNRCDKNAAASSRNPASRALRFVPRAHRRQRQDGDNSTALPSKEQAGGAVNGR
jgi:hypothetical protein